METRMRTRAAPAFMLLLGVVLSAPISGEDARAQPVEKAPPAAVPPKNRNVDVVPPPVPPIRKGVAKPAVPDAGPVPQQRRSGADQEYRECLQIWDKGTHMTRAEWAATCRRVQNRLNTVTGQAQVIPGRRRVR